MNHPFALYHHYLNHSKFGSECVVCEHTHPEIDHKMYALFGILGLGLILHMVVKRV